MINLTCNLSSCLLFKMLCYFFVVSAINTNQSYQLINFRLRPLFSLRASYSLRFLLSFFRTSKHLSYSVKTSVHHVYHFLSNDFLTVSFDSTKFKKFLHFSFFERLKWCCIEFKRGIIKRVIILNEVSKFFFCSSCKFCFI